MSLWHRLQQLLEAAAVAFFLICLAAVIWLHPRETAWYLLAYGGPLALILGVIVLCSNWTRLRTALLLRRNPEVLTAAAEAFDDHADELATALRRTIRWDSRSDYILDDWEPIIQGFLDTEVMNRLQPRQRALIAGKDALLRQEAYILINAKTWDHALASGGPL